jgi:hypothetical protein
MDGVRSGNRSPGDGPPTYSPTRDLVRGASVLDKYSRYRLRRVRARRMRSIRFRITSSSNTPGSGVEHLTARPLDSEPKRSSLSAFTSDCYSRNGETNMQSIDRYGFSISLEWHRFETQEWLDAHKNRGLEFCSIPLDYREHVYAMMCEQNDAARRLIADQQAYK